MAVDLTELKTLVRFKGVDTSELQLYADDGQGVVDDLLANVNLSDSVKARIARFLAAHFYVVSVEAGGLSSRKVGESQDSYRTPASDKVGYQSTRYGQQACALDTTGTLSRASMNTAGTIDFAVMNVSGRSSNRNR